MKPILTTSYWICPNCNTKNSYVSTVMRVFTIPEIICYKCDNCDYHYDERERLSDALKFHIKNRS